MPHPYALTDRVAFITGSTRGIGWATARALAEAGACVAVNGQVIAIDGGLTVAI